MHLAERRGERGLLVEAGEPRLPVRPELGRHATTHKGPAHRWRVGLQLGELAGIFRRQRVGNGGEQLRCLHQRAFQAAKSAAQFRRVFVAVEVPAEVALAGEPRGQPTDRGADPGVVAEPPAQRWTFVIRHR